MSFSVLMILAMIAEEQATDIIIMMLCHINFLHIYFLPAYPYLKSPLLKSTKSHMNNQQFTPLAG